MSKALVVIDMQNDFIDGALGTAEAVAIVPHVVARLEKAKAEGEKIIITQDTHADTAEEYLQTQEGRKLPVPHCLNGSKGWEIAPAIAAYIKDSIVLQKPTFGFVNLPPLVADADTITVIGLCTDICVISNALLLKAHYPEAQIIVDSTCCAGVTPESHANALNAMKMCQIEII